MSNVDEPTYKMLGYGVALNKVGKKWILGGNYMTMEVDVTRFVKCCQLSGTAPYDEIFALAKKKDKSLLFHFHLHTNGSDDTFLMCMCSDGSVKFFDPFEGGRTDELGWVTTSVFDVLNAVKLTPDQWKTMTDFIMELPSPVTAVLF